MEKKFISAEKENLGKINISSKETRISILRNSKKVPQILETLTI